MAALPVVAPNLLTPKAGRPTKGWRMEDGGLLHFRAAIPPYQRRAAIPLSLWEEERQSHREAAP